MYVCTCDDGIDLDVRVINIIAFCFGGAALLLRVFRGVDSTVTLLMCDVSEF